MEWIKGDMIKISQEKNCDVIAFSANNVIKNRNTSPVLVMGAGAALSVKKAFPNVDHDLGIKIVKLQNRKQNDDYFLAATRQQNTIIVALQVKRDWREDGIWDLTIQSLERLKYHLDKNPELTCVLNCPLIGLGGFSQKEDEVKKMVSKILKNNKVYVCTF